MHVQLAKRPLTFSYELPIGAGKALGSGWGRLTNALAGGWQVSGFLTFQSGAPLGVISQSSGTLWDATQRPNLIGHPNPGGSITQPLDAFFDPAAFRQPAVDVLGSAPRTLNYRSQGIRGEFRFELQNAANTPSFGFPSSRFGSTDFGRINGYKTTMGPRQAQDSSSISNQAT